MAKKIERPLRIDQRENEKGDFWYVLLGGNYQVLTTSEMYSQRDGALRAARRFAEYIDPDLPLVFSYWSGDRKLHAGADGLDRKKVTERIR